MVKYHRELGKYFASKALFSNEIEQKGPNVRKVAEQPWQMTMAEMWDEVTYSLCDPCFIEAKVAAGMTFDLIQDYQFALETLPENQVNIHRISLHETRLQKWTRDLIAYSAAWTEHRRRLSVCEKITEIEPVFPEMPETHIRTKEEIEEACIRIAENPNRLDMLVAFHRFVNCEYYPLQKFGTLPGFTLQHMLNYAPSCPISFSIVRYSTKIQFPFLQRVWPPDALYLPNPTLLQTLEGHRKRIRSISITPDGKRAVSGSDDRTLRVWDLKTGQCLRIIEEHSGNIETVSITTDGKKAVVGGDDERLRIWDLESGQCLQTLYGHTGEVKAISITPDGKRAVSGSSDNTLRLWDLENGQCQYVLKMNIGWRLALNITADGLFVLVASDTSPLQVWNVESKKMSVIGNDNEETWKISVTPDGRRAVTGGLNSFSIWDLESRKCQFSVDQKGNVGEVCITPNGRIAVSGLVDNTFKIWDVESQKCLRIIDRNTSDLTSLSVTADARRGVSGGDYKVQIWDLESGQRSCISEVHSDIVTQVIASLDGKTIVSCSVDNTLRIWDAITGTCIQTLRGHTAYISTAIILNMKNQLVTKSENDILFVWDMKTGQCLQTLKCDSNNTFNKEQLYKIDKTIRAMDLGKRRKPSYDVDVSSDEQKVLSCSCDTFNNCLIYIWDLDTGKCIQTIEGGNRVERNTLRIDPNGVWAVAGTLDGALYVWDIKTGQNTHSLSGHIDAIRALAVSFDGRRIVSGAGLDTNERIWKNYGQEIESDIDNTLRIWDTETWQCLKVLKGHTAKVETISINQDGLIVSTAMDNTIRIWDLDKGQCLRIINRLEEWGKAIPVSSKWQKVITGNALGTVIIWDTKTGQKELLYRHNSGIEALTIIPGTNRICVGDTRGDVVFLDVKGMQL